MGQSPDIVLSVIIPVYNSEEWLVRCLDSVLSQVVPIPWEIILIDDGSTDNSAGICDNYARSFARLHVFHTINQGASFARKMGIQKARGEYISFVDSDDFVKPGYLKTLYELIKESGSSISACAIDGSWESTTSHSPRILFYEELMPRFFKYEYWGLVAKMFSRSLFETIQIPRATISEDYYVMVQLFAKEKKMAFSPEALYIYNCHSDSLSHTPISNKAFEEFENVKSVLDFTSAQMPEYRDYALSNATETAVKLLLASRNKKAEFHNQRKELSSFLAENRFEIISCRPLLYKTRLLAFLHSL